MDLAKTNFMILKKANKCVITVNNNHMIKLTDCVRFIGVRMT